MRYVKIVAPHLPIVLVSTGRLETLVYCLGITGIDPTYDAVRTFSFEDTVFTADYMVPDSIHCRIA
jgi:hypothetical protein